MKKNKKKMVSAFVTNFPTQASRREIVFEAGTDGEKILDFKFKFN